MEKHWPSMPRAPGSVPSTAGVSGLVETAGYIFVSLRGVLDPSAHPAVCVLLGFTVGARSS